MPASRLRLTLRSKTGLPETSQSAGFMRYIPNGPLDADHQLPNQLTDRRIFPVWLKVNVSIASCCYYVHKALRHGAMEEWMGRVIAFVNSKGGGGKTTFAWQLGNVWSAAGKKVLLIDTDPQGTLSIFYAKWATRPERPGAGQDKGLMEGISESLGRLDARLKRARAEDWDF